MIKIFNFFFDILPQLFAWVYLFGALIYIFIFIKQIKGGNKQSVGKWILFVLNIVYVLAFLILRIFFAEIWKFVFSVLGLVAIISSYIWSVYEEKRTGNRWWTW